jgi:uncharacterized membrane protein
MLWPVPPNQSSHARMVRVIHAVAPEAIAIAIVVGVGAVVAQAAEAIVEAMAVTAAAVVVDAEDAKNVV